MTKGQARLPHESQKGYHARLKKEKFLIRGYLKGRRIFNSMAHGTYTWAKYGSIGSATKHGNGSGFKFAR